ncbi:MAG: CBS domain-containing protein [Acidimicrobiales bacterium]
MAQKISDVMTRNPVSMQGGSTVTEAAAVMKEQDIGDVIVMDDGSISGILTDRDLVVRAIAESRDLGTTAVADICSSDVVTVNPSDEVGTAIQLMREHSIRRIPVVENGEPVGIVSIGDLAMQLDDRSALAEISAAPANT